MLLASELDATKFAPVVNAGMKNIKILAGVLVMAALAVMVKWHFFPAVKNDYFALNGRSLQQVPAGLVVLRPTHFPFLRHEAPTFVPAPHARDGLWIVGRNSPLREVIAAAYDQYPARVELPLSAPKGNFDFLVTVNHQARQRLQAAIRQKLGYSAQAEIHETPVLALNVANPGLPGLTPSDGSEPRGASFDDVKIHFTSWPVAVVPDVLKSYFDLSVVDKTGLTNSYDFALRFDASTRRQMRDEATARASADKVVQELGLKLESDLEISEILVVKPAVSVTAVFADRKRTQLGPLNGEVIWMSAALAVVAVGFAV